METNKCCIISQILQNLYNPLSAHLWGGLCCLTGIKKVKDGLFTPTVCCFAANRPIKVHSHFLSDPAAVRTRWWLMSCFFVFFLLGRQQISSLLQLWSFGFCTFTSKSRLLRSKIHTHSLLIASTQHTVGVLSVIKLLTSSLITGIVSLWGIQERGLRWLSAFLCTN